MNKFSVLGCVVLFGFATTALADDVKLPPASTKTGLTFTNNIKPIFDKSCIKCHDSKKKRQGAKLSLDTLAGVLKGSRDGKVIKPGDSAHSDLVLSVAHIGDPHAFMPKAPRGEKAEKLSDEQIGLIRAWIDQGAK